MDERTNISRSDCSHMYIYIYILNLLMLWSTHRLLATLVENPITQTPILQLIREEPCNLFLGRLERLTRCPPSADIFEYAHERIFSALEQRTMFLCILSTELFYCETNSIQRTKELYRRQQDSRRLISNLLFNISQNKGLSEILIEDLCSGWAKDRVRPV